MKLINKSKASIIGEQMSRNPISLSINMKLIGPLIIALIAVQVSAVPTDTDLGLAVKNLLLKLKQTKSCGSGDGEIIIKKNKGKSREYIAPDIQ